MAVAFNKITTLAQAKQYATEGAAAAKSICPTAVAEYNKALLETSVAGAKAKIDVADKVCDAEKPTPGYTTVTGTNVAPTSPAPTVLKAGFPWWVAVGGVALLLLLPKKKGKR